MNVDGAIKPGVSPPAESSVDRARRATSGSAPAPGSGEPPHEAPAITVEGPPRPRPAAEAFAARKASKTRGGTRLHIDEATNQVIAQIVNVNNEVIKQLPPEERLRIAARYRLYIGLVFDKQI